MKKKLILNLRWGAAIMPLSWKFVRCKQLQALCGHRMPGGPGFTGWPWTWIPATLHSFLKLKDNNKRKWTTTSQCTALFLLDDPVTTFYMPATLHSTLSSLKLTAAKTGEGDFDLIFLSNYRITDSCWCTQLQRKKIDGKERWPVFKQDYFFFWTFWILFPSKIELNC